MLNLIEEVIHFMIIIYMTIFEGYVGGDFKKRLFCNQGPVMIGMATEVGGGGVLVSSSQWPRSQWSHRPSVKLALLSAGFLG